MEYADKPTRALRRLILAAADVMAAMEKLGYDDEAIRRTVRGMALAALGPPLPPPRPRPEPEPAESWFGPDD